MVDILISVVLEALFEKYSIQGNGDWVVELDSSTECMTLYNIHDIHPYLSCLMCFYLLILE